MWRFNLFLVFSACSKNAGNVQATSPETWLGSSVLAHIACPSLLIGLSKRCGDRRVNPRTKTRLQGRGLGRGWLTRRSKTRKPARKLASFAASWFHLHPKPKPRSSEESYDAVIEHGIILLTLRLTIEAAGLGCRVETKMRSRNTVTPLM